jgi:hypothetical protein
LQSDQVSEPDIRQPEPVPPTGHRSHGDGGDAGARASSGVGTGDGAQSWRNLLQLDAEIFAHRGIRMLTPEARVLINLKLNGPMSVTAAMDLAGVSYRGFYAVLDRLKQAGLVDQVKDRDDQRVRNLQLDPTTPIPASGL